MGNLAVTHDEHQNRLETKLKRELGDQVLALLSDDQTEDMLLNADGALWVKRIAEGIVRLGGSAATGFQCPQHNRRVARYCVESRTSDP
jgi:Flp pilus assembly CpaF family ATPase